MLKDPLNRSFLMSKKNKILTVSIFNIGNYINWEFNDVNYNIIELLTIYDDILNFLVSGVKLIYISQFFDEGQGLSIPKGKLHEIQQEYHLDLYITNSYTKSHQMGGTKNSYIVNLIGKPTPYWLKYITFFGGTSLSNIIFGFNDKEKIEISKINELNQRFSGWYWLESNNEEIEVLCNNSAIVCWTSDSRLNTLLDAKTSESLTEYMNHLRQVYPIEFRIQTE
jgi:hypothetical protein